MIDEPYPCPQGLNVTEAQCRRMPPKMKVDQKGHIFARGDNRHLFWAEICVQKRCPLMDTTKMFKFTWKGGPGPNPGHRSLKERLGE